MEVIVLTERHVTLSTNKPSYQVFTVSFFVVTGKWGTHSIFLSVFSIGKLSRFEVFFVLFFNRAKRFVIFFKSAFLYAFKVYALDSLVAKKSCFVNEMMI